MLHYAVYVIYYYIHYKYLYSTIIPYIQTYKQGNLTIDPAQGDGCGIDALSSAANLVDAFKPKPFSESGAEKYPGTADGKNPGITSNLMSNNNTSDVIVDAAVALTQVSNTNITHNNSNSNIFANLHYKDDSQLNSPSNQNQGAEASFFRASTSTMGRYTCADSSIDNSMCEDDV